MSNRKGYHVKGQVMSHELYKKDVLSLKADLGIDFATILEKVDERDRTRGTDNCSVVALCDFLAGELTGKEKKRIEDHLKTCIRCQESMKMLNSKNPHAGTMFRTFLLPKLAGLLGKPSKHKTEPVCGSHDSSSTSQ